jgi:hypothetical protein
VLRHDRLSWLLAQKESAIDEPRVRTVLAGPAALGARRLSSRASVS